MIADMAEVGRSSVATVRVICFCVLAVGLFLHELFGLASEEDCSLLIYTEHA
jgi:hypothetical protein